MENKERIEQLRLLVAKLEKTTDKDQQIVLLQKILKISKEFDFQT